MASWSDRLHRALRPLLWEDDTDTVVIGTGAGGATAARVLAATGTEVLMLEEGPRLVTADRPRDVAGALANTMREGGMQASDDLSPLVVLQGRCVGGSTAINSGIIWRMPEDVRADWSTRHGLHELVNEDTMAQAYSAIEADLGVTETSERVLGGNAALMAMASDRLNLPGKFITRNSARCQGRGECLQGCPGENRQSMDVSYVPRALADGARLRTHARVERVWIEGGRAAGVLGDVLHPQTRRPIGRFRVRARTVVVSAGAVHTPLILLKSGLHGLVGKRFQAHPGAAMLARFDEPVRMSYGATQGYEVPMRHRGFKLESLSLPPEMLAARLPGVGADWQERLANLDHYAQWCAQIRMTAQGRIRPGALGPRISYSPRKSDIATLQEALLCIGRMMFEVGAREVYPGIDGCPEVVRSVDELERMGERPWKRRQLHLVASHLFGTATAGADPRYSVVGTDLQSHQVTGLYVMDASVFPTNLGVNPQHAIMAVVFGAAQRLAASAS